VTKYRKAMSIPSSRQRRDWGAASPLKSDVAAMNGQAASPTENAAPDEPTEGDE
jgi:hypothetical protein